MPDNDVPISPKLVAHLYWTLGKCHSQPPETAITHANTFLLSVQEALNSAFREGVRKERETRPQVHGGVGGSGSTYSGSGGGGRSGS